MDFQKEDVKKPLSQYAAERLGIAPAELERFINEYMDMQVLYRSAIRVVSARLENLDDEFQFRHKRNPIHVIQTRLKTPQSTVEKMGRRNIKPNIQSIREHMNDIAGVRVICSYVDDIFMLSDLLCAQEGVELLDYYDYINHPKPNGYRSLHLDISVPVDLSDGCQRVPVEVQIRTIAMDFWASLEHELRYKSDNTITREIAHDLRECSDHIFELDDKMQQIYRQLERVGEHSTTRTAGEE